MYISHADNLAAVEPLKTELKTGFGAEVDLVVHIGTVLDAHTGPGAIAFCFPDKVR